MTFQQNPSSWQPPDGLGYSSLRPVRLTAQGIALAVLGVLFILGAPALAWLVGSRSNERAENRRLLSEQGVQTSAEITRVWPTGGKDSQNMVQYRFAADGRELSSTSTVPSRIWKGLAVGDSLTVRYLPGRPKTNHPVDWEWSGAPIWLAWILLPLVGLPGVMFFVLIRKQSRLLSEGRPAAGVITKIKRTDKQMTVYYEFTLLSGAPMKGRSSAGRRPPEIGSQVCVLYDPENPRRNAAYPLPLVKLMRS